MSCPMFTPKSLKTNNYILDALIAVVPGFVVIVIVFVVCAAVIVVVVLVKTEKINLRSNHYLLPCKQTLIVHSYLIHFFFLGGGS